MRMQKHVGQEISAQLHMAKALMALALLCAGLSAPGTSASAAAFDARHQIPGDGAFSAASINPVLQWNRILLEIVRTPGAQPATIHPTRSFAIMHAAIYDAVNAIDRTHTPYLVELSGVSRRASQEAATAAAAHSVLVALYPQIQALLDLQLQESLAEIPDGPHKRMGIQVGQIVAERILALRSNDGSNAQPLPFVPETNPGDYQLTPPNFLRPVFTHWPDVTPFTLVRADQFRPGPPPPLASDTYTAAFNEVKALGFINNTSRSGDQTEIGQFWGGAIQNYWNEIAQTAAAAHHLTTAQSARLFALLDLTIADSVIAFYDAKYTYRFWRPVTAIRAADSDENPQTVADTNWLPLQVNTPADPSYPGAHAVISAAGAAVLDSFFGSDQFSFTVTSEVLPGVDRIFTSFTAAAEEAALSRIFAGVHFRSDLTIGQDLGRNVADFVDENFLLPRHESGRRRDSERRG